MIPPDYFWVGYPLIKMNIEVGDSLSRGFLMKNACLYAVCFSIFSVMQCIGSVMLV